MPPPPVDRNNLGHGPGIMAATWIFMIFAFVAVTARFAVRRHKQVSWGWDDWTMMAALIFQLALQSLLTYSFTHGMGKHDYSLYPQELINILQRLWISVPLGIIVSLLSRTSVAILLCRLFSPYKWFIYFLISFTGLMIVTGCVLIPLTFVQVRPINALWNPTLMATHRMDPKIYTDTSYFFQSLCTFSDLTYALFPVIFIWKLKMPLRQKIGLVLVMGGSVLSMAMSILKTKSLGQVSKATVIEPDTQYKSSPQVIYGFVEQCTVIIIGCVPVLRPAFKIDFSRLSLRRLYMSSRSRKDQSTTGYASNGYSDLDGNSHNLSHLKMSAGGSTKDNRSSVTQDGQSDVSSERLVQQGHITRTDKYSVKYDDQKERIPGEVV